MKVDKFLSFLKDNKKCNKLYIGELKGISNKIKIIINEKNETYFKELDLRLRKEAL